MWHQHSISYFTAVQQFVPEGASVGPQWEVCWVECHKVPPLANVMDTPDHRDRVGRCQWSQTILTACGCRLVGLRSSNSVACVLVAALGNQELQQLSQLWVE